MVDPEVLKKYAHANHNPDAPENRKMLRESFAKPQPQNSLVVIRDIEASKHLTKKQLTLLRMMKPCPVTA